MPGFNMHWFVASQSCSNAPPFITEGKTKYFAHVLAFKNNILSALDNLVCRDDIYEFIKPKTGKFYQNYAELYKTMRKNDKILSFSAYMLGACGPDFWTVLGPSYHTAGIHFDLGHYNRTHRQFEVAIERWKWGKHKLDNLQTQVEVAYFMGMATHFATDLVIHQLVNAYAGAYNLLEDYWNNEQGNTHITGLFKKWNTHNKIELYWDSYVRHRYHGDHGPVFEASAENWFEPGNFPLASTLIARVNANSKLHEHDRRV